jgi:hypothetical protein
MTLVAAGAPNDFAAWTRTALALHDGGGVVHVAGTGEDLPRISGIVSAVADRGAFDQVVLDAGAGPGTERSLAELGAEVRVLRLPAAPEIPEDVRSTLESCRCTVLVVYDDDHTALCAALAAARQGVAMVRVGGVPRCGVGRVIARLADVLLTPSPIEHPLIDAVPERVFVIGNPLVETIERHARAALDQAAWSRYGVSPGGYVFVA